MANLDSAPNYDHGLDRLFLNPGKDGDAAAEVIFVDRTEQLQAFRDRYREVHGSTRHDPTDLDSERRNLLVFFGMGGIGKSSLSHACEALVRAGEPPTSVTPVTFRIDFTDPAFLDPETLLLSVRAAIGSAAGVRTPAFDLALGSYWATKHPGEPIRTFLSHSGWLAKITQNDQLAQDLSASIEDLLGLSSVASATAKIGKRLIDALRRRHQARSLLDECPRLEQILSGQDADEVRLYLPYLLAWDLHRLEGKDRVAVTIFADTFEEVQERSRGLRDIEDVVARLVYLMPNVLFVISGRHRLRWANLGMGQKYIFHGMQRWPMLADAVPGGAQVLVGQLDEPDATEYVSRKLGRLQPAQSLVSRIVATSDGWPLYLELQAAQAERLLTKGMPIRPADFGGPLVEVVMRVMRDLDEWERDLLRAASLVSVVNRPVLRTMLPAILDSRVSQFLGMSLLAGAQGSLGLNRALRESVPEADRELVDHWSAEEWETVAKRALEYYEDHLHLNDHALVTAAFLDGCEIGAKFAATPPWLAAAAERLFARGSWEVLRTPSTSERVMSSPLAAFASAAKAAALRATGQTRASLEQLRDGRQRRDRLEGEIRDYVSWQIVASSERSGDYATAAKVCDEIQTPAFRARALVRLGRLAWIAGDLTKAESLAESAGAEVELARQHGSFGPELAAAPAITYRNLLGWIALTQGRFDAAEQHFRQALAHAEGLNERFFIASEASHLALTLALAGSSAAGPAVKKALASAGEVAALRQTAQARVARALTLHADPDAALAMLAGVRDDLRKAGDEMDDRLPMLGCVLVLVRCGRADQAQRQARELAELMAARGTHRCVGEIATWLAFDHAPDGSTDLNWGEDVETVARRWRAIASAHG